MELVFKLLKHVFPIGKDDSVIQLLRYIKMQMQDCTILSLYLHFKRSWVIP